jgi:hypothetical protein
MANELETAIKTAAVKIAKYVDDAATLTVETRYVEIGGNEPGARAPDFASARPVARTIIKLDGENQTVVPMRPTAAGSLEVDNALFDAHQRNVATAIDYRARLLDALLQTLKPR